jgi:hypothetical protein
VCSHPHRELYPLRLPLPPGPARPQLRQGLSPEGRLAELDDQKLEGRAECEQHAKKLDGYRRAYEHLLPPTAGPMHHSQGNHEDYSC